MDRVSNGHGIVASDLHLGLAAAQGYRAMQRMTQHVAGHPTDLIVLNGDIVEGKDLSGHPAHMEGKMDRAFESMRRLLQQAMQRQPHCRMVYIIGNHDCVPEIQDRLNRMAEEFPNHFEWQEHHYRLRDTFFTHGDLPLSQRSAHPEQRVPAWRELPRRTGIHALMHDSHMALKGMVDEQLSHGFFRLRIIAPEILQRYRHGAPHLLDGVSRIVMGHIHAPYHSLHVEDGIEFRITGAATPFSTNMIYEFAITPERLTGFMPIAHRQWREQTQHC